MSAPLIGHKEQESWGTTQRAAGVGAELYFAVAPAADAVGLVRALPPARRGTGGRVRQRQAAARVVSHAYGALIFWP